MASIKSKYKSFSDVVLEFEGKESNRERILDLFKEERDLDEIDWKVKEKRMRTFRDSFNKRIRETRK